MAIKKSNQTDQGQRIVGEIVTRPNIRTMEGDKMALEKEIESVSMKPTPAVKPATETKAASVPPSDLPINEISQAEKKTEPIPPIKDLKPKTKTKKGSRSYWRFVLVGLLLIIITGTGGFFYWQRYLAPELPVEITHYNCQNYQCVEIEGEGENQCSIDLDCEASEPPIPMPFIPVEEVSTIEIDYDSQDLFIERVKTELNKEQDRGSFRQILLKQVSLEQKEYTDLRTLTDGFAIKLPDVVYEFKTIPLIKGEDYTLLSYGQKDQDGGNRLVLIVALEQEVELNISTIQSEDWESDLVADFSALLFYDETLEPATEGFQDNLYKGTGIRYINFPEPGLSIDYLASGNKFIITTSRESAYAVIDALNPEAETEENGEENHE